MDNANFSPLIDANTPLGEPFTLEQLRGMGGQPAWIVKYPDWGHWELSEDGEDYIADRDPELYGLRHDDPEGKYGLHKLGWLAYAYPPAHIYELTGLSRAEQAERERDAAIADLKEIGDCEYCSGKCSNLETEDCRDCSDIGCQCRTCAGCSNWAWRGRPC